MLKELRYDSLAMVYEDGFRNKLSFIYTSRKSEKKLVNSNGTKLMVSII